MPSHLPDSDHAAPERESKTKSVQRMVREATPLVPQLLKGSGSHMASPEATRSSQVAHEAVGSPGQLLVSDDVHSIWLAEWKMCTAGSSQAASLRFCTAQGAGEWAAGCCLG